MSSSPKKGRRACDQEYRRQARRERALLRRQKDVAIYSRILADKDAIQIVRDEAADKKAKAEFDIQNLMTKLAGNVLAKEVKANPS